MALDPSIPLQVRPFKLDDPLDKYGKLLALKGAQRQFTMEEDIEAAARESGGDLGRMAQNLMGRGQFNQAMQINQQLAQNRRLDLQERQANRKFEREEIEHGLKMAEAGGADAIALDTMWRQALEEAGGDPIIAVTKVQPAYSQIRQKWLNLSPDLAQTLPEGFDPEANFALIGQAKQSMEYLKSLRDQYGSPVNAVNPETGQTELYAPGKNGQPGRFLGVAPGAAPAPQTELARLQNERAAIAAANPNDPRLAQYDKVLANYKAGKGDTNVTVNTGPMTPGKTAANKVDEDMLSITRNLMQLEAISSQFKPEFQRYMDRGTMMALSIKEKAGQKLTPKEEKDLSEFAAYKRNSTNAMNEYIKSITGAAMTIAEAERLLKGLPNPGSGLFDGDSPTEFKAKQDDAIRQTKMAIARLAYIKRNGMSLEDGKGNPIIPLDMMPQIMNQRGAELEKELARPGVSKADVQKAVRRQLAVEFGLVAD